MLCYKDTTFCDAPCGNGKCPTKLTDQVRKDAEAWWGRPDAPIMVADRSQNCPVFEKVKT